MRTLNPTDQKRSLSLQNRRLTQWGLGLMIAALLGLCVVRAIQVPMTYDEAYSVLITENWKRGLVANNHPLNTMSIWLLRPLEANLGPFGLRISSLMGFVLSIIGLALTSRFLHSNSARVVLFCLALLNPLVLEFFSLARGYGLSIGLMAMAIGLGLGSLAPSRPKNSLPFYAAAAGLATLACYANPAFLPGAFCFVLILTLLLWRNLESQAPPSSLASSHLGLLVTFVLTLQVLASIPVLVFLVLLSRPWLVGAGNESLLYLGGDGGFISDSVQSIMQFALWPFPLPLIANDLLAWGLALALAVTAVKILRTLWTGRPLNVLLTLSTLTLLGTGTLFSVSHVVLSSSYPLSRSMLTWTPLVALFIAGLVDIWTCTSARMSRAIAWCRLARRATITLVAGSLAISTILWANSSRTIMWTFDASSDELAEVIIREQRGVYPVRWCDPGVPAMHVEMAVEYYLTSEQRRLLRHGCQRDSTDEILLTLLEIDSAKETGDVLLRLRDSGFRLERSDQ